MTAVDQRLVTLSLSINGQLKTYSSPMYISSTGKASTNPVESQVEIKIANLSKSDQDYLAAACSPYNKDNSQKIAIFSAGRISTGANIIFQGNISTSKPKKGGVSANGKTPNINTLTAQPPPDIILAFKCQEHQYVKGNIVASQQPATALMSQIANQIAADCGLTCNFQATDKNISNYAFTGPALKQVSKLNAMGVSAWADGSTLYVTDPNAPLANVSRVLDLDSGLIGIPEVTEQGVKLTYLLDNTSKRGGALQLISKVYPTLNGTYRIFDLGWNISSREVPFYWIADCKRISA